MFECQIGKYVFTVKEGEGDFRIALEPSGGQPSHLKGCDLGFYLPEVTTVDGAQDVASYLNENLGDLILVPPSPPRHRESDTQH